MKLPKALQSRKFWLAAIGVIAGICLAVYGVISNDQAAVDRGVYLIMLSVGSYISVEGAADVVGRSKALETEKLVTLAKLDSELGEDGKKDDAATVDIVSGSQL